ncbi:MAG: sigma-70 family RNA polymerase sigma factor [Bacteroidota bacterium]
MENTWKIQGESLAVAADKTPGIGDVIENESAKLLAFIRSRVPDWVDAEDVLQDVFYQLSSTGLDSINQVQSWLFTVARNRITDIYRKKRTASFSDIDKKNLKEENVPGLADILPDFSQSPDVMFTRTIIMKALEEALEELPENQREVFEMHEFEDMSFKEISSLTGVSVNTLLSRKRYAVVYLRKRLAELYESL